MPILNNPKHERFAQALASGKTLEVAHREAGFSGNRKTATTVAKRPDIARRIRELSEEASQKLNFDRCEYIRTLKDRFITLDPTSPVAAKYGEMLAKAQGWNEPDKVQVTGEIKVVIGGSPA